jgi:hypothetical protein
MDGVKDLWAPTQSPQTMPDGPGESFEAYRAKLGKPIAERFDTQTEAGAKAYLKSLGLYLDTPGSEVGK